MGITYAPHPSGKLLIIPAPYNDGDNLLRHSTLSLTKHVFTKSRLDRVLSIDIDEYRVLSRPTTIQEYMPHGRFARRASVVCGVTSACRDPVPQG